MFNCLHCTCSELKLNSPGEPLSLDKSDTSKVHNRGSNDDLKLNDLSYHSRKGDLNTPGMDGDVKSLNCMYTNADSIMNKREELEARIEVNQPDIIAISEVYPKVQGHHIQSAELQLDGFDCFTADQEGRGVCIYTRKWMKATAVNSLTGSDFSESVWCETRLKNNDILLIGCVYRSPNSSQDNNDRLMDLISMACNMNKSHLLIMGDFNYPDVDWSTYTSLSSLPHGSSQLIDCLHDNFIYQTVRDYTRFREGQQPSLLDLVIVNDEMMIEDITIEDPLGKSDHAVLIFDVICHKDVYDHQPPRFVYDKGDYEALSEDLALVNWSSMNDLDANGAWEFVCHQVHLAIERNIPKTKPFCRGDSHESKRKPPWMCQEALTKVKRKHHAWRKYMNTKQQGDYQSYVRARNDATNEVKKAKRQFEMKLAEQVKGNPKSFWKYVRSKTKVKSGISDLQKEDGSLTQTDVEKAELLNKFFASVFTDENLSYVPDPDYQHNAKKLEDINISREDVLKKLKNLKPSKAPGPDGLHPRVLKEAANVLADPLAEVFNKSISEGSVPDGWKLAHVKALFKKGKSNLPSNYRPVSLTSIVCKIMESILRDAIMKFLDEEEILNNHQHGFRAGRSCVTELLDVIDTWTKILDEGGGIDVAYLDFSKAFDSVPHQRLLRKVKAYGVDGKILRWIESFLIGRKQRVVINNKESSWADVKSGIPQGSVLGPILFVIFINDLPDNLNGQAEMFADDTKVFQRILNPGDCDILQSDLDSLSSWADKWQLKFNIKKCGIVHYGRQSEVRSYEMSDGSTTIKLENKTEEKDLGVLFDPTLKFSKHISAVASKANRNLGLIRRTFSYMNEDMFRSLYKTLIRPHLEYANCVWSPLLKRDINTIEKVQRRATKIIPSLRDRPYDERLRGLHLPTLAYRRLRGDMIQVYRIMNGLCDMDKDKLFEMKGDQVNLRGHALKIQKQHARLNIRKNNFTHRVVSHWNMLPKSAVEAPTVNSFKSEIDAFFSTKIDKYTYMDN